MEASPNQYTVPMKEKPREITPEDWIESYAELADFVIEQAAA